MKSNTSKTIIFSCLILLVILAIGFSMGLHSFTIIEWWKPVAICAVISLPVAFFTARFLNPLTNSILDYLEYPAAFVISFSVFLAAFYSSNFFLSNHNSGYEYEAPVVRKYSQVRTRSHKTGRRGYHEEKYTVYIIELEMKDGKIKKMEKPLKEYNKIKKGSHIDLLVEKGLFSIPVIKKQHVSNNKSTK